MRLVAQYGSCIATTRIHPDEMLEQLAVRTEDGRLIYQDMLCMSWVAVCDVDRSDRLEASPPNRPQT
jgi:hypothetical protein